MPKIRCKSCEAVLNVPEKALGKTINCPKCSQKFKVPERKKKSGVPEQKSRPQKKRPTKAKAPADDDLLGFGDIDDYSMEDEDSQICPYCAADMDLDEVICRGCGMNVETGKMDRKEEKRRKRKGPDSSKFYREAFSESWKFMLEEPRMAVRIGTAFTLFMTLSLMCGYVGFVYITDKMPPKVFWIGMCALTTLSVPGLIWYLSVKVVEATRLRQKFQSDRIPFDLFTSIASGVRVFSWPMVMIPGAPAVFALGVMMPGEPIIMVVVGAMIGVSIFLMPMALVHMTAKYTYKGWILWELMKIFFQNFIGLLYFHFVAFVAFLPALLVAGGILFAIKGSGGIEGMNPFGSPVVNGITHKIASATLDGAGLDPDPDGFMYFGFKPLLNIFAAFLIMAPIGYLAAWPTVFVMKANGLFGYYFSPTLGLVDQMPQLHPATFWVRYLSHMVDGFCSILAIFLVTRNAKLSKIAWGLTGTMIMSLITLKAAFFGNFALWLIYTNWMYWTVQEASEIRATMGKEAFGLVVLTENDRQLTMKQATMKWIFRIFCDLLGGLPYLLAAIPPKKRALHDMMTKTKVVWVGDR